MSATAVLSRPTPSAIDLEVLKTRQKAAWSSGDYAVVGTTLQIVGESLAEAMDVRAGSKVLDVAAGNGNAALAAARRWCEVTATDYVPALLDRARERARAERLAIAFREADAEALPFADQSFDFVMSVFGVMFVANHEAAADELLRTVRKGGSIGLANWTPEGFIGQVFKTIGKHVAPPAGARSPALWGTQGYLEKMFPARDASVSASLKEFVMRYRSPAHWLEIFRTFYGPVLKTFGALDAAGQEALAADLTALIGRFNRATDGTMVVPSEYLEAVITRR
jgi:ubiquinone/menaquinone biosynthesis C-methylase UbiE